MASPFFRDYLHYHSVYRNFNENKNRIHDKNVSKMLIILIE